MAGASGAWRWHHSGTVVDDLDAAIAFHRETLGFEVTFEVRGLTDLIRQVTGVPDLTCSIAQLRAPLSDTVLELLQFDAVPDDADETIPLRPGQGHAAFLVDDLDLAVAALATAGGALCGQITAFSEGRGAYVRTPVGTVVELLEQPRDTGPADASGAASSERIR